MATGALTKKDEYRNDSSGWIGVVQIDGRGDHRGFPVAPGDSVWLSEEEQIATANAPRDDADNPFLPRAQPVYDNDGIIIGEDEHPTLVLVTKGADVRNRRPYGTVTAPITHDAELETGATPVDDSAPLPVGQAAAGEEVATPAARTAARRRRTS